MQQKTYVTAEKLRMNLSSNSESKSALNLPEICEL